MPRRRRWVEALLVAFGVIEGVLVFTAEDSPPSLAVLTPVLTLVLLLRHRRWRWLLPVVLAANVLPASLTVLFVGVFSMANRARSWLAIFGSGILGAAAVTLHGIHRATVTTSFLAALVTFLIAAVAAALGMYAAANRHLLEELRRRADDAEASRAAAQEEARSAERTRIAREMHDIMAHKISLVALQAGALEVNSNLEREQVSQAAGLIRETAAESLKELREVLGVLRGHNETAPLVPQPTWQDVRALVSASQEAGVNVELFDFIDDEVPSAMARTAYRVVQEGLTNIHKHARHSKARVALIGEPGMDLVIEVSNVLPQGLMSELPGARMGLSGIEARVAHAGGTITAGPTDDGRFEVKAVIPWPAT